VKFIVQGEEFDDGAHEQNGHIEIDFGLDSLFVQENVELTEETQAKIRDNVAKLVEFTKKAEMNTRATSRRLWSESEESLPQKLIARLQKVQ
jgi:ribosomal protein L17